MKIATCLKLKYSSESVKELNKMNIQWLGYSLHGNLLLMGYHYNGIQEIHTCVITISGCGNIQ